MQADRAAANHGRAIGTVVGALLGLVLVAACGGQVYRTTSAPPPSVPAPAPVFNDADVTFAQQMIPHHQQAIQMAQMAQTHSQDPRIHDLARRIIASQQPEIQTMTGWLQAWGKPVPTSPPPTMPHPSMPMPPTMPTSTMGPIPSMPGMASEQDMTQMMDMHGPGFDRMFLQMMIHHHQGAVDMARTEQAHGINPDAKALAHTIENSQTAEIGQMQQLLGTIPSH